jgi:hypothetical protein
MKKHSAKDTPRYQEKMLLELIWDSQTLDDLVDLCDLLNDLEAQKDLVITAKMCQEVKLQQQKIIYSNDISDD